MDTVDLTFPRRLVGEIVLVRKKLNDRGAAHPILGGELPFAKPLAIEIGDNARAVKIEFKHLEMVADVSFNVLLREIDPMGGEAIRTARLLPYDGELLAACSSTFKVVRKLKKAIEKPVLAVEPVVGHDRRRPRGPNRQRQTDARNHQGAP